MIPDECTDPFCYRMAPHKAHENADRIKETLQRDGIYRSPAPDVEVESPAEIPRRRLTAIQTPAWLADGSDETPETRLVLETPCVHGEVGLHTQDGWDSRTPNGEPPSGKQPNHACDGGSRFIIDAALVQAILRDTAELIAGLEVPISLGMGSDGLLGTASDPWHRLYNRLAMGWASADEIEERLLEVFGLKP